MRSLGGSIPFLDQHMNRLFHSVNDSFFNHRLSPDGFWDFYLPQPIQDQAKLYPNHYFRITFESIQPMHPRGIGLADGKLTVTIHELPPVNEKPLKLKTTAAFMSAQAIGYKAGSYFQHFYRKLEAQRAGFDDALLVSSEGWVSEASTSALVLVKGKRFFTPDFPQSIESISLKLLEQYCMYAGFDFDRIAISKHDLAHFDSAYLANAVSLLRPVGQINDWRYTGDTELSVNFVDYLRSL
jgi:branched-subunit amino acid aminotransferase/4-amino-4-deoxychorismate lyase